MLVVYIDTALTFHITVYHGFFKVNYITLLTLNKLLLKKKKNAMMFVCSKNEPEVKSLNKIYDLLLMINNSQQVTQRKLAEEVGLSLGTVNTLLGYLEEHHFIAIDKNGARFSYSLTQSGKVKLKELLEAMKSTKLKVEASNQVVKRCVILAAGKPEGLAMPATFTPFTPDGVTPFSRMLGMLNELGIEKIDLVLGYQKEACLAELNTEQVTVYENLEYEDTGTMSSLSKVFEQLHEDFILIDGDLVFEEKILADVVHHESPNVICCTSLSGSGDEAFVDMDEEDNLVRISKDIRQMNQLSAEMIGISKISSELLEEMKHLYTFNNNQWLNYEYLILQASKTYEVKCLLADNVAWEDIDSLESLRHVENYSYPTIKRREDRQRLLTAKESLIEIMNLHPEQVKHFKASGGMTNTNYRALVDDTEYFIRIPGACTEVMINRESEALNAQIGSALGINVDTLYSNPQTGIKITEAVPGAETLSPRTARVKGTLFEVAEILSSLHHADISFLNTFSFIEEWEKYEELVREAGVPYFTGYEDVKAGTLELYHLIGEKYGYLSIPCHNDLVAENFVRSNTGKLYLLDWEYSGMNDPAWDLAAFSLENELADEELAYFLRSYYQREATFAELQKVRSFQIYQDVLWSVWTIAKEAGGQDFGSYGIDRFNRGKKQLQEVLSIEKQRS